MAIHSKHTYNLSTDIYNLIQVLYITSKTPII